MCLTIDSKQSGPWNKNKFRWKIYAKFYGGALSSLYRSEILRPGWNKANARDIYTQDFYTEEYDKKFGFHVFVSRKDARDYIKYHKVHVGRDDNIVIRKMEVCDHLKSGTFQGYRAETWKYIRLAK